MTPVSACSAGGQLLGQSPSAILLLSWMLVRCLDNPLGQAVISAGSVITLAAPVPSGGCASLKPCIKSAPFLGAYQGKTRVKSKCRQVNPRSSGNQQIRPPSCHLAASRNMVNSRSRLRTLLTQLTKSVSDSSAWESVCLPPQHFSMAGLQYATSIAGGMGRTWLAPEKVQWHYRYMPSPPRTYAACGGSDHE